MAPSEVTQLEERMVEEVKEHEHLYIPSHKDYKNGQTTLTSWREIAVNVGLSVKDCKEKWRTMRDRFMRIKKTLKIRSVDAGGKKVPDFYTLMSFLEPHVRHRDTSSDFEKVSPAADAQADASATPDATPAARLPSASSCALAESALLPSDPETQTAEGRPLGLEEGDTIADITTESSIQLPRNLPSTCHVRKTKRTLTELESSLQSKVAKLEERRAMLQQQQQQSRQQQSTTTTTTTPTANRNHREEDDEVDRFGQMVGDMMRRLPEDLRPETMFEVHKVLYEAQQKAKQLAASAAQQVS